MEESSGPFVIRKKFFSTAHYVEAARGDGARVKIARFCNRTAAEYWLETEAQDWLSLHPSFAQAR